MALASNVSESQAMAADAPLTARSAAQAARQRAPRQSITMRCKNLEDNLIRNRELMEDSHDFCMKFRALKGSDSDPANMTGQGQESSSTQPTPRLEGGGTGGFAAMQQTMRDAERERRSQILFGAPGGPAAALATYRPASLTTTPRASNFSSPPLSHRSSDGGARMRLQQAGNTIGISAGADIGGAEAVTGQKWKMRGSFQLRMDAMEMNAQRNAEQLDSQRSFLDEINAVRADAARRASK